MISKSKKLFERLKQLNLPNGKYAVFGSAPMCIRRLREARDLDLIVTKELFEKYKQKSEWIFKKFERGGRNIEMLELENEEIEFYKDWGPGEWDIEKLIRESEIIDGLPFVKLEEVVEWKKVSSREKDLKDIELIKNYKAINELWYETEMFNKTGLFILEEYSTLEKDPEKKKIITNTFYESFLIHTRSIACFLENKKYEPKDDSGRDIVCSDFSIPEQSVNLPQGYTVYEINKFVQHLTEERINSASPEWKKKIPEILKEINKCLRIFLDKLHELSPNIYNKHQSKFEPLFEETERMLKERHFGKVK